MDQKKMKRHVILGLSLLLAGIAGMAPGRVQAASMAVLVVGLETDAASEVFAAGIRYEFAQKGYTMVNDAVVQAKLVGLRKDYKDGNTVDTVGLAVWGKENSIDFVLLVVENACSITVGSETMNGREQLMHVVSCGTEKYTGRGYYRTRFVPQKEMLEMMLKEMVYVAGGVFQMGCESGGRDGTCGGNGETPVHYVRVNSFYIGKYEVTQGLWKMVMGDLPSSLKSESSLLGDNKPVVYVSRDDITDTTNGFFKKLNDLTGKNYRLPTEAEWEYAARGCSEGDCESYEYSGSDIIEDVSWYSGNSTTLHVVGLKFPNKLGLYDMSGNAYEWCSDWYSATYYPSGTTASDPQDNPKGPTSGSNGIIRGGSWTYNATRHVAFRGYHPPSTRNDHYGFRLV
jgi:formylglycine-generating enzyme required for sulfatase activity